MIGAVKVKEINLERGNPTVETAMKRLVNELSTAKGEDWMNRKKDFLTVCSQLRDYDRYVGGNQGLTVILLR